MDQQMTSNSYGIGIENLSIHNNTRLHHSLIDRKLDSPLASTSNHPQRVPLSALSDNNTPKSVLLSGVQRVLVKPKSTEKVQKTTSIHSKGNFMKPTEASRHVATPVANPTPTRNTTNKSVQTPQQLIISPNRKTNELLTGALTVATATTPNSGNNKVATTVLGNSSSKYLQSFHTQSSAAKVVILNKESLNHPVELGYNNDMIISQQTNYGTPNRSTVHSRQNRPTSTPPSSKRATSTSKKEAAKLNYTPVKLLNQETVQESSSSSHLLYSPLTNKTLDKYVDPRSNDSVPSKPSPSALYFPFMHTNLSSADKHKHSTPLSPSNAPSQHYIETNTPHRLSSNPTTLATHQPSALAISQKPKAKVIKSSNIPAPTADILSANKAAKLAALSNHNASNSNTHNAGISSGFNPSSPPLARYAQATLASSAATANIKQTDQVVAQIKIQKKPPRAHSKIPVPIATSRISSNTETHAENTHLMINKNMISKKIPRITNKKSDTASAIKDEKVVVAQIGKINPRETVKTDHSELNDSSILNILNLSSYIPRRNTDDIHYKVPIKELRTSYSFGSEISGVFDSSRVEEQTFSLVESIEFSNSQILDASATVAPVLAYNIADKTADIIADDLTEKEYIFLDENLANVSIVEGPATFSPCNISLLSNFSQATFGIENNDCPVDSFIPIHTTQTSTLQHHVEGIKVSNTVINSESSTKATIKAKDIRTEEVLSIYKPKIKLTPMFNQRLPNSETIHPTVNPSLKGTATIPVVNSSSDPSCSQLSEVSYILPITRQNSSKSSWTDEYSAFFPPDEIEGIENETGISSSQAQGAAAAFVSSPLPEQYHQSSNGLNRKVLCSSITTEEVVANSCLNKGMIMSSTMNSLLDSSARSTNNVISHSGFEEESNNMSIRNSIDFSLASCSTLNKAMILSYDQEDIFSLMNKIGNKDISNESIPVVVTKLSSESAAIEQAVRTTAKLNPPPPPLLIATNSSSWMLQSIESLPPPPPPLDEYEQVLPSTEETFDDSISILELPSYRIPTHNDLVRQFSSPTVRDFEDLDSYKDVFNSDNETIEVEYENDELVNYDEDDYEESSEYDEYDKENIDPEPLSSTNLAAAVSTRRLVPGNSPLQSITSTIAALSLVNESQDSIISLENSTDKETKKIIVDELYSTINTDDSSMINKVQQYLIDESHKKFNTAIHSISKIHHEEIVSPIVMNSYPNFETETFHSYNNQVLPHTTSSATAAAKVRMDSLNNSVISLNDSQQQASFTSSMEELQSHNPRSKSEQWVQNHYSSNTTSYRDYNSNKTITTLMDIDKNCHQYDTRTEVESMTPFDDTACDDGFVNSIAYVKSTESDHHSNEMNNVKFFVREDCFDDEQVQQKLFCPDPLACQLLNMVVDIDDDNSTTTTNISTNSYRYNNNCSINGEINEIPSAHMHSMQHMFLPVNEKDY